MVSAGFQRRFNAMRWLTTIEWMTGNVSRTSRFFYSIFKHHNKRLIINIIRRPWWGCILCACCTGKSSTKSATDFARNANEASTGKSRLPMDEIAWKLAAVGCVRVQLPRKRLSSRQQKRLQCNSTDREGATNCTPPPLPPLQRHLSNVRRTYVRSAQPQLNSSQFCVFLFIWKTVFSSSQKNASHPVEWRSHGPKSREERTRGLGGLRCARVDFGCLRKGKCYFCD